MDTICLHPAFISDIGWTEMVLILVVALLLFGAKNLPRLARGLGKSMEEFKRAARDVKDEIMKADEDEKNAAPSLPITTVPPKDPTESRHDG